MYQCATKLKAVNHAEFYWKDQFGNTRRTKPKKPTVNGVLIDTLMPECQERALKSADRWTPVVRLFLSMSKVIRYEGKRAVEIWKTYCAEVYSSNKKKVKQV